MMNVFTEKTLGSPFTWAPSAISGSTHSGSTHNGSATRIAKDLLASRQLWNGLHAG